MHALTDAKYSFARDFSASSSSSLTMNNNCKNSHWKDMNGSAKHFLSYLPKDYTILPNCNGSNDLRRDYVYPSELRPQPAFQSPLQSSPKSNPSQDFQQQYSYCPQLSLPDNSQLTQLTNKINDITITTSSCSTSDEQITSDESVTRISYMFPTVTETHIRNLLRKYFNREALVISALQVEKYPMTTPGPSFHTLVSPSSASRNLGNIAMGVNTPLFRSNSRTTAGVGSPFARPLSALVFGQMPDSNTFNTLNTSHTNTNTIATTFASTKATTPSSPRIKLRYVKNQFPEADETIILNLLYNNEKNVQKVSEDLVRLGYKRKTKTVQKVVIKEEPLVASETAKIISLRNRSKFKSAEDKAKLREELRQKYASVSSEVLAIALESVHYNYDRATQILDIMVQEELESKQNSDFEDEIGSMAMTNWPESAELIASPQIDYLSAINQSDLDTGSKIAGDRDQVDSKTQKERAKIIPESVTKKTGLDKGSNSALLLKQYEKWTGPNANNRTSSKAVKQCEDIRKSLAKGSNPAFLMYSSSRRIPASGPNSKNYTGPVPSLAKCKIDS